jgi:hypothetical protein
MSTIKKQLWFVLIIIAAPLFSAAQKFTSERKVAQRAAELNISRLPKPNPAFNRIEKNIEEDEDEGHFVNQNKKTYRGRENKSPKPAFPVTTVQTVIQGSNVIARPLINESPCITYPGLNGGGSIPPDVSAAAGFDHIMMALNDSMAILDKYGNILRSQRQNDGTGFWSALDTTGLFDPKIVYQPFFNRWFYVIAADSRSAQSAILIAISQSYDPMQGWNYYRIDTDPDDDQWFDYPSIGFNNNWFVVNGNMGDNNGTGVTQNRTFIFNINQLMAGTSVDYTIYNYSSLLDPQFTFCPALTYDASQNDLWLVTNDDVNDNDLRFFQVTGGPSNPSISEESYVSIGSAWGKGGNNIAPQAGTAAKLNCADHDVMSVVWRNGRLYTAQTIFLPDGDAPTTCTIQVVSCNPYDQTVYEAIRFGSDANYMYAYPCIAVNADNDMVISCAKFSNTTYPSAAVIVRRNGSNSFTETNYKQGEDWYINNDNQGRNRWGDYTAAMMDPSDDNSVWVASEYSKPKNGSGRYATWWAKICAGSCAASTFVNTVQPAGTYKKYEASFSVIATSEIQPGANIKLNAGGRIVLQPGFKALQGCRVRTYLEGCGSPQ